MGDLEWQLRNWYNFVWLSGDGLVEQACHSIDKIAWALKDQPPIKAVAVGGRQIPNNEGNIFDHISVVFEFPNDVRGFMGQRQTANCYGENADYLLGSEGVGKTNGWNPPTIKGKENWRYRESPGRVEMYQQEHNELFASIRSGQPINDGHWMTQSTLMAIMGRTAAYTGQEITWEQIMNAQQKLVPDKLDWNLKLDIAPMAMPGATRVV
jgi:predicted dehydrogenase